MLHHTGKHRTYNHNLRLAALLCLTAGFVNGAGYLSFYVLTTNVTGHVALFAEKLATTSLNDAAIVGMWMVLFLFGAFVSSLVITRVGKEHRYAYAVSILIEIAVLVFVGVYGMQAQPSVTNTRLLAGSLLFAMGLQNAMVSMISGSAVRTTHLTGVVTDLGIDLAAATAGKPAPEAAALRKRITLRLVIIFCFFLGCVSAAYLYGFLKFDVFFIPAAMLALAMFYDIFRYKVRKTILKAMHSPGVN